jgi:hypothetical protein
MSSKNETIKEYFELFELSHINTFIDLAFSDYIDATANFNYIKKLTCAMYNVDESLLEKNHKNRHIEEECKSVITYVYAYFNFPTAFEEYNKAYTSRQYQKIKGQLITALSIHFNNNRVVIVKLIPRSFDMINGNVQIKKRAEFIISLIENNEYTKRH